MLNIDPEIIVTHHHGDLNIDHKIISKAVLTACRPHPGSNLKRILSFEVPSATGWDVLSTDNTFTPNWYEDISFMLDLKIEALREYESEIKKWPHFRSFESIVNIAKYRGEHPWG